MNLLEIDILFVGERYEVAFHEDLFQTITQLMQSKGIQFSVENKKGSFSRLSIEKRKDARKLAILLMAYPYDLHVNLNTIN